jgi:hypothetical protein
LNEYDFKEKQSLFNEENNSSSLSKSRFDLSLKLFYNALENILIIEKKRSNSIHLDNQQIQQAFQ